MDNEPLIKKLRAAHKAIELALEALAEGGVQGAEVGTCSFCGEPIFESDRVQRGVHYRCYHNALTRVRDGETTWEALEKAGLVQPASKGGRPRQPLNLDPKVEADAFKKLDAAAADLPTSKKPPKK
ncbi:MAG: hypothetical protein Aurels2KO_25720 [Aureliella sp.]